MTSYAGIDYGLGKANIDKDTGIHYGVISQHSVMPEAMDNMEMDYGKPTCPECGNDAVSLPYESMPQISEQWGNYSDYGCDDYACLACHHTLDSSDVFSDEALGFSFDKEGYKLCDCLDSDIFVLKSPYYTYAQYCSPCVPGAGNLESYCPDGPKTYCLGHDWFSSGKAPYPVFDVATGKEV